ncbi:outer envelope pore protein 24, chloroplastic-like [Typha angustifolia]|uniref:outer envelope pore protein 24, chloroplastic-like n=1 Tax=Typha angustifolia TaxID=59011 RepID=UPI003C3044FD
MTATLTAKYETDKKPSASVFFNRTIGQVKLSTSVKDVALGGSPSLQDVSFSLEKPDSFSVNYSANKNVTFKFMNSITVLTKAVNFTYTHEYPANRTVVDGTFPFDNGNKMTVNYGLGTGDCKVKYKYESGEKEKRQVVVEPSYDLMKDAWDLAVTGTFEDTDVIKATYATKSNVLGVQWSRKTRGKVNWSMKVSTSFNLAERQEHPKFMAETTLNYDI